ncbi:hypothetical protein L208DRAFT_1406775 [Tricholoma matsutake]|nr:hypothetical protein L208DRAFT_1406775 [Tricholoma matsutake 945]
MGTPFSWHFRNLGLPSLFSVDLPQTGLSIGFANFSVQSNEDVFLEPSDNTPSQMWFFEKYIPFDKEKVHAQRQPGIDEGTYYIQNCYDSTNYMNYVGSPPRIQSGGPKSGKTTRFTLKYEENSAELTLAYNEVSSTTPPTITPHRVADVGGSLSCANMATNWVLLKEDEKDPGY